MLASAGTAALDHEKIRWKTGSFNTGIVYRKTKAVSMHADRNRKLFMANFELLIMRYNSLSEFAESGNILLFCSSCFGAEQRSFILQNVWGS